MPGVTRGAGFTYVSVSKGKLVVKQPDGTKAYYDSWSNANLVGIKKVHDEKYDRDKWCLLLRELNGDSVIFQFTDSTWFAMGFFERILNCRLDLPIEIGVMGPKEDRSKAPDDESRSKTSFCYIRQDGETVKKDDSFPRPTKVMVNKKKMDDYTEVEARIEQIVAYLYEKGVKDTTVETDRQPQQHHGNDEPAATQKQSVPHNDDYPIPDEEPPF